MHTFGEKSSFFNLTDENALMNSIIDRFGEDAPTQIVDKNHFTVEAELCDLLPVIVETDEIVCIVIPKQGIRGNKVYPSVVPVERAPWRESNRSSGRRFPRSAIAVWMRSTLM